MLYQEFQYFSESNGVVKDIARDFLWDEPGIFVGPEKGLWGGIIRVR